jgi:ankyrin repeat protein
MMEERRSSRILKRKADEAVMERLKIKEDRDILILKATISGDIEKLNEYQSSGFVFDNPEFLQFAAHIGHIEICQFFLSKNILGPKRLLYHALKDNHIPTCLKIKRVLSRKKCNKDEIVPGLETISSCLGFCGRICDYSFDLYNTPNGNRVEVIKLILSNDNNRLNIINNQSKYDTPLHWSINLEGIEETKIMLEAGLNPNLQDKRGCTPLHIAVIKDNFELCKMLLDYGADMDIKNYHQKTPIEYYRSKEIRDFISKRINELETMRLEMKRAHPDEHDDDSYNSDNKETDKEELEESKSDVENE